MPKREQTTPFSIRLPDAAIAILEARAVPEGLKGRDLARKIILKNLAETESPLTPLLVELRTLSALIIAALSETVDLEQARELVAEHTSSKSSVTP